MEKVCRALIRDSYRATVQSELSNNMTVLPNKQKALHSKFQ